MKNKNLGKPVIIVKQLHSSCSSAASSDRWIYFKTNSNLIDFKVNNDVKIYSKSFVFLNSEVISEINENLQILIIYLKDDRTYYYHKHSNGFLGNATKEQMNDLVKSYINKGWLEEQPSVYEIYKEHEKIVRRNISILNGCVIPEWSDKLEPNDYKGGLSNSLFKEPYLQKYLKSRGCFGYIGHYGRTFNIDRAFENEAKRNGYTFLEIAIFICGKDGRHFGDSLEDYTQELSIKKLPKLLYEYMENAKKNWLDAEKDKILSERKESKSLYSAKTI